MSATRPHGLCVSVVSTFHPFDIPGSAFVEGNTERTRSILSGCSRRVKTIYCIPSPPSSHALPRYHSNAISHQNSLACIRPNVWNPTPAVVSSDTTFIHSLPQQYLVSSVHSLCDLVTDTICGSVRLYALIQPVVERARPDVFFYKQQSCIMFEFAGVNS